MVVVEIISVMGEVVATMVTDSPTEDMVEIVMLLTLLILWHVFLALHKDVALWDAELLKVLQVVVVDKVVMLFTLLVVLIMLLDLSGDGVTILPVVIGDVKVKVKAVGDLPHYMCPAHCMEQYHQGKEDPNQGYNEQYYANGEEQYYKEGQAEYEEQYQAETGKQEEEQTADAHWLDEFGI